MADISNQKSVLLQQFFNTLAKIRKIVDKMSAVSSKDWEVTALQMRALHYLKVYEKVTVGELANALYMSRSSTAQLIDRLYNLHFIKRENDLEDRRIIWLSLSQKGEKELESIEKLMFEKMKPMLSYMSEEEIKTMVDIHSRILERLEKDEKIV